MINPNNLTKILFLITVSVISLIDTALDLVFVASCYASGVVWLAIIVGISYIYTFFDKIHSTRKLFGIARELYNNRFEKNILLENNKKI